ncbi:MAG TPA: pectinesterase family protein [Pyrinomonadaceae bacterium]
MNELPRRKLIEIVARKGRSIIENPGRVKGLLRDYCGAYRREISVLAMALEEHAVPDLLSAPASLPRKVLLARLARRLCDNLALSEEAAIWSIESWALALSVISAAELETNETAPAAALHVVKPREEISSTAAAASQNRPANSVQSKPRANSFIVAADGSGDFKTIGEALQKVAPNARLLVREGFYDESIILDKNIEILGDGAFDKIIVRSVNSSCILMQTDKASVRGLSLRGSGARGGKAFFAVDIPKGELILESCDISSDSLSCIAVHGVNSKPAIKNCRIHDGADSGLYFYDNARGRVENCDVYRNANVGVAITQGANPALANCRVFQGNNGGVVAWGNGAAGVIENCHIFGHRLANIGISEYANPIFRRCEIYNGQDTGVYVHANGFGTLEECNIYKNSKAEVGVSQGGNSIFRRCAIHDGENSGVILQNRGRTTLESCNIYDNADAGVAIYGESTVIIRRCNIHRNGKVAVRVKEQSAARVENCDLRGNRLAAWETEYGITLEESGNRD